MLFCGLPTTALRGLHLVHFALTTNTSQSWFQNPLSDLHGFKWIGSFPHLHSYYSIFSTTSLCSLDAGYLTVSKFNKNIWRVAHQSPFLWSSSFIHIIYLQTNHNHTPSERFERCLNKIKLHILALNLAFLILMKDMNTREIWSNSITELDSKTTKLRWAQNSLVKAVLSTCSLMPSSFEFNGSAWAWIEKYQ